MMLKKALLGLAAAGTILGSTAAQAAPAPAAVNAARSGSAAQDSDALAGGFNYGWALLAVIAAGVVAIAVSDDDDAPDVAPVSP